MAWTPERRLGGLIVPFIGINIIDLLLQVVGLT